MAPTTYGSTPFIELFGPRADIYLCTKPNADAAGLALSKSDNSSMAMVQVGVSELKSEVRFEISTMMLFVTSRCVIRISRKSLCIFSLSPGLLSARLKRKLLQETVSEMRAGLRENRSNSSSSLKQIKASAVGWINPLNISWRKAAAARSGTSPMAVAGGASTSAAARAVAIGEAF